jgi:ribosomal protein L14E/L6E/L27E
MKLDDIQIGTEYALNVGTWKDPRRVKALEIVTVEEQSFGRITGERTTAKRRRVKVKYIDGAPKASSRSLWNAPPAKGSTSVVHARDLVCSWAKVAKGIQERHQKEQAEAELRSSYEQRLRKLLGRQYNGYVSISGSPSLTLYDKSMEKLIALAELGKGSK